MGWEEKQAEISDITRDLTSLEESLEQAESCENEKDFEVNLREALAAADSIKSTIKQLLK